MTGVIEVTVKVYLNMDVPGDSDEAKAVVNAILDGDEHELMAETELIEWKTEDDDEPKTEV